MAYQIYQGGSALAAKRQADLEERRLSMLEQQQQRAQSPLADIFNALKEGVVLANQITGIQSNLQSIDKARAQAGLATTQAEQLKLAGETKARQAKGIFESELEAAQAGFQVGAPERKYSEFERPMKATVGGVETTIFKPLEASQKVELAKKESDIGIERLKLAEAQQKDKVQRAAELANNEKELRKEYNAHPQIKEFNVINQNYNQVVSSAKKQNPSGADDLKLITSYIKILDPNSVVREGEIANVTKSSGLMDQAIAQFNRVSGGGTLDANIRNQILSAATDAYGASLNQKQDLDSWYASIAQKKGFDLSTVLPKDALMTINIQAPDIAGGGTVIIPEAQAAGTTFDPDLFTKKWGAITNKQVKVPKRGTGILGR